jgi:hypothetical protein
MKFFNKFKFEVIVCFLLISCVINLRIKNSEGELFDSEYNVVIYIFLFIFYFLFFIFYNIFLYFFYLIDPKNRRY